jgi:MFS family permease
MIEQLLAFVPQILQYLGALFTGAEWKALLVLVGATLAGTHTLKVAWRLLPWQMGGGSALINLFAALVGFALAYPIWRAMAHDDIPWYVAGVIAGPLAVLAFKLAFAALKWKAPELARAINGDRRKPGDRRHVAGVAPGGAPERREAERRKS